jgi:predicted RNA binding protein YcfA (HicA-like mRNA interferase family)
MTTTPLDTSQDSRPDFHECKENGRMVQLSGVDSSITVGEAVKELRKVPNIRSVYRHTFNRNHIKELGQIITSTPVVEVDEFMLTGELSEQEYFQFLFQIPQTGEAKQAIAELSDKIVQSFKGDIMEIARATVRIARNKSSNGKHDKKWHIGTIHNHLQMILEACHLPFRATMRSMLMDHLNKLVYAKLFRLVREAFLTPELESETIVFYGICHELNRLHMQKHGIGFPAHYYFEAEEEINSYLNNPRFRGNFDKAFTPDRFKQEDYESTKKEHTTQFEEITDLSQCRQILPHSWESGEMEVVIFGDELTPFPRSLPSLFYGTVNLNPHRMTSLVKAENRANGEAAKLICPKQEGQITFHVDRESGELMISTNYIPLSEVLSERDYLALKSKIYEITLKYLRNKEPDIEDFFAKSVPAPQSTVESMREEARTTLDAEHESLPPISYKYVPYEAPEKEEDAPQQVLDEAPEELTSEQRKIYIQKLKGLKGQKVINAITRLLGEKSLCRITGSHHMFRSKRTGRALPITIHATQEVKFFFLLNNLQGWGYSLQEFCEALK